MEKLGSEDARRLLRRLDDCSEAIHDDRLT
jgi:hypothetical protein